MDDSRAVELAQYICDGALIADIAFDQNNFPAGDRLDPLQRFGMTVAEVVENDDIATRTEKFNTGM